MTTVDFGGLEIVYDDSLLAPRPWTRAQSQWARDLLPEVPQGDVLELCSGAGHIGLLAVAGTGRKLVCVDLNPAAARCAQLNAAGAWVDVDTRVGQAARVLRRDERFPMIIADPPWVVSAATAQFPQDPRLAIDGGPDGLQIIREIVAVIADRLAAGGVALLQLAPGDEQADAVAAMLARACVRVGERRYFPRGTLLRLDA